MRWTAGATTRRGLDLYVLYVTSYINYYQKLIVVFFLYIIIYYVYQELMPN